MENRRADDRSPYAGGGRRQYRAGGRRRHPARGASERRGRSGSGLLRSGGRPAHGDRREPGPRVPRSGQFPGRADPPASGTVPNGTGYARSGTPGAYRGGSRTRRARRRDHGHGRRHSAADRAPRRRSPELLPAGLRRRGRASRGQGGPEDRHRQGLPPIGGPGAFGLRHARIRPEVRLRAVVHGQPGRSRPERSETAGGPHGGPGRRTAQETGTGGRRHHHPLHGRHAVPGPDLRSQRGGPGPDRGRRDHPAFMGGAVS